MIVGINKVYGLVVLDGSCSVLLRRRDLLAIGLCQGRVGSSPKYPLTADYYEGGGLSWARR